MWAGHQSIRNEKHRYVELICLKNKNNFFFFLQKLLFFLLGEFFKNKISSNSDKQWRKYDKKFVMQKKLGPITSMIKRLYDTIILDIIIARLLAIITYTTYHAWLVYVFVVLSLKMEHK